MKKHSPFSPSSFERRYLCPASYLMEKDLPSVTSKYSAVGTLLHELLTNAIREYFFEKFEDNIYIQSLSLKHQDDPNKELILDCFSSFLNLKNSLTNVNIILDKKFDLKFIAEEESGTVDLIITGFNKDSQYEIHVIDFKFGAGVHVLAGKNLQLLCYAKGYIDSDLHSEDNYDLHLHIFQPTFYNTKWSLSSEEKEFWILNDNFYKNVVSKCKDVEPEFNPTIKACKFCKAKAICKPLASNVQMKDKNSLTTDELKDFLDKRDIILLYVNSLEEYAKNFLENGGQINGYTLVDKFSNRKWIKDAEKQLEELLGDEAYVIKKSLVTVGKAEKLLNKEIVNSLTEKELVGKVLQEIVDNLKHLN